MAKTHTGTVASNKSDKTIVVSVQTSKIHPLYRKRYIYTKRFMAHDEKNEAKEGDKVIIMECRPLSKTKNFVIIENLGKLFGYEQIKESQLASKHVDRKEEKKETKASEEETEDN